MGRTKKEPLSDFQKMAKKIGDDWEDVVKELEAADGNELKTRVTQASQAIHDASAELNANSEYTQAKEDVKLLSSGLKDVRKRQSSIIKVCLHLRKERGEV